MYVCVRVCVQTKHGNRKDKHALGLPQWQVARAHFVQQPGGNFSRFFVVVVVVFGIFIAHGQLAGRPAAAADWLQFAF